MSRLLLLVGLVVTALLLTAAPASACHPESLENPEANHHGCGGDGSKGGPGSGEEDSTPPVIDAMRAAPTPYCDETPGEPAECFTGFKVNLRLSEAATVSLILTRRGRLVATYQQMAPAGASGTAYYPKLRPGRYVLTASALDAAGNRSLERRRRLKVRHH